MKKLLVIFLIVGLCGAGGYIYLQKGSGAVTFGEYLPADAVGYFQVNEFDTNVKRLFDTQMYQSLAALDFGSSLPQGNPLQIARDVFEKDPNAGGIRMLLKHQFAIAMYDVDLDFSQPVDPQVFPLKQMMRIFDSVIFAAKMDAGTKVAEKLISGFKDIGQDVNISDAEHAQETYHVVSSMENPVKMYYVTFDDVLVMTLSEDTMKRSIDAVKGTRPVLANDETFKTGLPDQQQDMFGYYDANFLTGFMRKMSEQTDNPVAKQQIIQQMASLAGFDVMSYSYQWDENLEGSMNVKYDSAKFDPKWRAYYASCVGTKNKTLAYVPESVLLYHWAGCIDWQRIVDEYTGAMAQTQEEAQQGMAASFSEATGQYVKILGSDIGGYLTAIDQGMFPIPHLVLMIGLSDVEAVKEVIEPMTQNPMVRVEKMNHAGQEIWKVVPPVNVVTPGFTFVGDHIMIATHIDLLTAAIDRANGTGTGLKDNPDFKKLGLGSPDDGVFAQYIAFSDLITEVLKFEEYGKGMLDQQADKQKAFQEGSLRRLDDIQSGIKENEQALLDIENQVVLLEDEVFLNEVKGEDVTPQKDKIQQLKQDVERLRQEITIGKEQEADTQAVLDNFQDTVEKSESMNAQVDDVVVPVLESLKNLQKLGIKTVVFDEVITTNFFMDVK